MLRYVLKSAIMLVLILFYVSTSLVISAWTRDFHLRQKRLSANICRWARVGLRVLGITVEHLGAFDQIDFKNKNFLVLCNHLSYTDVMIIAAAFPAVFVTSVEVRDSAFVGFMSALGGSMFVERRSREKIEQEIADITDSLRAGSNVVIFPEGTSSNGESVLPFKRSLLKSALDARVDVLPLVISYPMVNGHVATSEERDLICYYGKREFFDHLKTLLSFRSVTARLQYIPEVSIAQMNDRKEIADHAYAVISQAYAAQAYHHQLTTV